jgi:hypothetical protein
MKKILIGFILFFLLSTSIYTIASDSYNIYPKNITNVSNKANLNLFLDKVLDSRKEFNNDQNYLVFLNRINQKLDSLRLTH